MDIQQEHDPDDPDASNVYDFNDGEDPTLPKKQEIEVYKDKTFLFNYFY